MFGYWSSWERSIKKIWSELWVEKANVFLILFYKVVWMFSTSIRIYSGINDLLTTAIKSNDFQFLESILMVSLGFIHCYLVDCVTRESAQSFWIFLLVHVFHLEIILNWSYLPVVTVTIWIDPFFKESYSKEYKVFI